jgi:Uncharacterized conserved protein (DUF2203)
MPPPPRYWTAGEADAALEWVAGVVERARAAVRAASQPAAGLRRPGAPSSNGHRPAAPEPGARERALGELAAEGIVVRDLERGLVDFPAVSPSGREYWLCWIVGEPAVTWWHWPDAGFAGRTPLADPPT